MNTGKWSRGSWLLCCFSNIACTLFNPDLLREMRRLWKLEVLLKTEYGLDALLKTKYLKKRAKNIPQCAFCTRSAICSLHFVPDCFPEAFPQHTWEFHWSSPRLTTGSHGRVRSSVGGRRQKPEYASLSNSDTLPLVPSSIFAHDTSKTRQEKAKCNGRRWWTVTLAELAPSRLNRISQFKYKFVSLHKILKV